MPGQWAPPVACQAQAFVATGTSVCRIGHKCLSGWAQVSVGPGTSVCQTEYKCLPIRVSCCLLQHARVKVYRRDSYRFGSDDWRLHYCGPEMIVCALGLLSGISACGVSKCGIIVCLSV